MQNEVSHPRHINSVRPDDYPKFMGHLAKLFHVTVGPATINRTVLTNDLFRTFRTTINGTPLGRKLERFSYMRGKFRVRIAVQGSSVLAGKFVVAFQPFVQNGVGFGTRPTGVDDLTIPNSMVVPHLVIDPSKTESLELVLDAPTSTGHWTMQSVDNFGSYRVVVEYISPLFSGTAVVPDISYTVYGALEESASLEGITLLSSGNADDPFGLEEKKDVLPSTVAFMAGDIAGMAGTVFPQLSPMTTIFSRVAGGVGSALRAFGYARPPITEVKLPTLNRFMDAPMHSSGPSSAFVLGASQTQSLGISPELCGGDGDEMSFDYLCKIPGFVGRIVATPATPSGTRIAVLPVGPSKSYFNNSTNYFEPTPMAGIAQPFEFWTGDITIHFEIVASIFHRVTLLIAWDCSSAGTSLNPTMEQAQETLPNYLVTVSGNTTVKLDVPWAQQTPWLFVEGLEQNVSPTRFTRCHNGFLHVYVVNPVTSNGSTSNIPINLYYSSRNIRFALPNPEYIPTTSVDGIVDALDTSGIVVPLSGNYKDVMTEDMFLAPPTEVDFGPPSDLTYIGLRAFGETPMSVKELSSKMVPMVTLNMSVVTTDEGEWIRVRIPDFPPWYSSGTALVANQTAAAGVPGQTGFVQPTWLAYFSSAYVGYRGSIRRGFTVSKLFGNDIARNHWVSLEPFKALVNPLIASEALPPQVAMRRLNRYSALAGNFDISPMLEVVVPSVISTDFHVNGVTPAVWSQIYHMFQVGSGTPTSNLQWQMWAAAGDDATFVRFVGFPATSGLGTPRP